MLRLSSAFKHTNGAIPNRTPLESKSKCEKNANDNAAIDEDEEAAQKESDAPENDI